MPLIADRRHPINVTDLNVVRFTMFNGERKVLCGVTYDALQDIAALDGLHEEPIGALFERFRSEVEFIASRKYDARERSGDEVIVNASDV